MAGSTRAVMSRAVLEAMASEYGFRVETFATTLPEIDPPKAYTLYGPRGNKRFVMATDDQGGVDAAEVKLWWDGVCYSTRVTAERRAARKAGRRCA